MFVVILANRRSSSPRKAPLNPASAHNPRNLPSEMPFERRTPWHQEVSAIIQASSGWRQGLGQLRQFLPNNLDKPLQHRQRLFDACVAFCDSFTGVMKFH